MKILFYISTIRGGGAAKVMSNLANQFCISNEIVFVTNFPGQHEYVLDGRIKRFNLEAEESRENILKKNFKRIICLRKYIKKETPDVVISFMGENNFRAIFANGFLRSKLIVSVRNDPDREYSNRLSRLMAKSLYRLADGCVFQTKDAMEWFPKSVQRKSRIILNQVDEKFLMLKGRKSKGDYYYWTVVKAEKSQNVNIGICRNLFRSR